MHHRPSTLILIHLLSYTSLVLPPLKTLTLCHHFIFSIKTLTPFPTLPFTVLEKLHKASKTCPHSPSRLHRQVQTSQPLDSSLTAVQPFSVQDPWLDSLNQRLRRWISMIWDHCSCRRTGFQPETS